MQCPCLSCGLNRHRAPKSCKNQAHITAYNSSLKAVLRRQLQLRIEAIMILGGKCINCGNSDVRVLQINHKNGGGNKDFKENSVGVYRRIINHPETRKDYDVRCANCNILYEYEVGRRQEYPIDLLGQTASLHLCQRPRLPSVDSS